MNIKKNEDKPGRDARRLERERKRSIRKIIRKKLNSAAYEDKVLEQDNLTRQHEVKGTKSLLNALGGYGKKKK